VISISSIHAFSVTVSPYSVLDILDLDSVTVSPYSVLDILDLDLNNDILSGPRTPKLNTYYT